MGIDWVGCAEIDPIGFVTVDQHQKLSGIEDFKKQVASKIEYLTKQTKKRKEEEIKRLQTCYLKPDAKVLRESLTREMLATMMEARKKAGDEYAPEVKKETTLLVGSATFRKKAFIINKFPIVDKPLKGEVTIIKGLARVIYGDRILDGSWLPLKSMPKIEKTKQLRGLRGCCRS
ncbi:hypothetical protein L7F22_007632 [Adiantum nelumboides]|nr:hypothetical protein [Adiantum nelumboides]